MMVLYLLFFLFHPHKILCEILRNQEALWIEKAHVASHILLVIVGWRNLTNAASLQISTRESTQPLLKGSDLPIMMQHFLKNEKLSSAASPLMPINSLLDSSSIFGLMGKNITSFVVTGVVRVKYGLLNNKN